LPTSKDVTKKPVVYCPPAYDPLWSTSYSSGTQIEVDETIYECNPYPFNIYCILPSFKPVYGNELWTDAWTEISQCVATEPTSARPTTKKPTERPTSKPTAMVRRSVRCCLYAAFYCLLNLNFLTTDFLYRHHQ
jgi:hypothetical protein